MTFGGHNSLIVSLVASFATSLRFGTNDATRATNKLYALQKSCDCPIIILIPVNNNFNKNFHSRKISGRAL